MTTTAETVAAEFVTITTPVRGTLRVSAAREIWLDLPRGAYARTKAR